MSRYYMGPLDRESWLRHLHATHYALNLDLSCLVAGRTFASPKSRQALDAAIAAVEGRIAALEEYDIYCLPEDILARINADPRRI